MVTLVLLAAGALVARVGQGNHGLATALLLASGGLGVLTAWTAADAHHWSGIVRLAAVAGALVVTLVLLGYFSPLGRGGLIGAGAVAVITMRLGSRRRAPGPAGPARRPHGPRLGGASRPAAAARPDGIRAHRARRPPLRRSLGRSRHDVGNALAATHRGLALATMATALSAAAAGWLLTTAAKPTVWTVALPSLVAVVLLSRARAFPLVAEVVALLAASAVLLVRLVVLWIGHDGGAGALAVLCVAALLPLAALAVQPPSMFRYGCGAWPTSSNPSAWWGCSRWPSGCSASTGSCSTSSELGV